MALDSTPLQPLRLFGPPHGALAGVLQEIENWGNNSRTPEYPPPPYEGDTPSVHFSEQEPDAPPEYENFAASEAGIAQDENTWANWAEVTTHHVRQL